MLFLAIIASTRCPRSFTIHNAVACSFPFLSTARIWLLSYQDLMWSYASRSSRRKPFSMIIPSTSLVTSLYTASICRSEMRGNFLRTFTWLFTVNIFTTRGWRTLYLSHDFTCLSYLHLFFDSNLQFSPSHLNNFGGRT